MAILAEFQVGQVLWSIFYIFLFFLWFWLIITIFADIIRSDDLNGWGKALWAIGLIILPFLGIFLYLIVRGGSMGERSAEQARQSEAAFKAYVQDAAGSSSPSDQLSALADLHAAGKIDDGEYARAKARVLDS